MEQGNELPQNTPITDDNNFDAELPIDNDNLFPPGNTGEVFQ